MLFKISVLSTALFLVGCSSSSDIKPVVNSTSYTKQRTPENFNDYVQFLKGKAASEGVSLSVLNAQNNIYHLLFLECSTKGLPFQQSRLNKKCSQHE